MGDWVLTQGRYDWWNGEVTDRRADDETPIPVETRQDCEDLIALLNAVKERLP